MRHFIPAAALAATLLAACSEDSTAPDISVPDNGRAAPAAPSFSATLPGTSVTINDGSCTLAVPSTGEVRCDFNVSNPDGMMINVYPTAELKFDYQCVSPSTNRVQSTGIGYRWVYGSGFEGITATNPIGSNVKLGAPTVPNNYVKKDTKLNACKGKQVVVVTNSTMLYWEIYVDNWYYGQPANDYTWNCLGVNDSRGCESAILE